MSRILSEGEYFLEEGMTLERTGKFVSVRPITGRIDKPRCSECKYFGHGKATIGGFTTTICLLQPKNIIDWYGKKLYYHIGPRKLACDKFVKKLTE